MPNTSGQQELFEKVIYQMTKDQDLDQVEKAIRSSASTMAQAISSSISDDQRKVQERSWMIPVMPRAERNKRKETIERKQKFVAELESGQLSAEAIHHCYEEIKLIMKGQFNIRLLKQNDDRTSSAFEEQLATYFPCITEEEMNSESMPYALCSNSLQKIGQLRTKFQGKDFGDDPAVRNFLDHYRIQILGEPFFSYVSPGVQQQDRAQYTRYVDEKLGRMQDAHRLNEQSLTNNLVPLIVHWMEDNGYGVELNESGRQEKAAEFAHQMNERFGEWLAEPQHRAYRDR